MDQQRLDNIANRIDYTRLRHAVCWGVVSGLFWFLLIAAFLSFTAGFVVAAIRENLGMSPLPMP